MPQSPETQHRLWRQAVDALGGIAAAAHRLGMSSRHCSRLYSGAQPLHDGILRETARALISHADLCRALERQLSPAFASNLTARQLGPADMRGRVRTPPLGSEAVGRTGAPSGSEAVGPRHG